MGIFADCILSGDFGDAAANIPIQAVRIDLRIERTQPVAKATMRFNVIYVFFGPGLLCSLKKLFDGIGARQRLIPSSLTSRRQVAGDIVRYFPATATDSCYAV